MGARDEARDALYAAAKSAAAEAEKYTPGPRAQLLIAAATAYRAIEGGPQVGGVPFEK